MAKINLESKMAKLYELQTQLKRDLEDHKKLVKQYKLLIDIVTKSNKSKDLPKDFLEAIKNYCKQSDEIVKKINLRLTYIATLTDWYEKKDEKSVIVDQVVTLTFESLGIMDEPVPAQEPAEEQPIEEKAE